MEISPTTCDFDLVPDTDEDNLPDYYEEEKTLTDPLNPDTDKDGILDGLEDMDFDGLTNSEEYNRATHPREPDIFLSVGINLFGYPLRVPNAYSSYDLIADIGTEDDIIKIEKFDHYTGTWFSTYYKNGVIGGDKFMTNSSEGYIKRGAFETSYFFYGRLSGLDYNITNSEAYNVYIKY